jgi:hypothetical protein
MLGAASLLAIAPRWLVRQTYLVLVRELGSPLPRMPCLQSMSWSVFTSAEIPLVQAINPALSEAESLRRLEAGQECLLFWLAGAPVYYRWDTTRPAYLPYLSKVLRPLDGDLVTVDAFTHPAFRNRGIHSFATSLVLQRAARSGLKRSVTMVAWWNRPARRVALEKAERSIAGIIGWWGLGPYRRYYADDSLHLDGGEIIVLGSNGLRRS